MAIDTGVNRPTGSSNSRAMDPLTQFFNQLEQNPALYNAWRSADSEGAGGYNLAQQYLAPLNGQNFSSPEQVSAAVSGLISGIDPTTFRGDASSALNSWRQDTLPGNPGQNSFFGMNPDTAAFLPLMALGGMAGATAGAAGGSAAGGSSAFGGAGSITGANVLGAGDLALTAMPQVTASSLGLTGAQALGAGAAGGAASGLLSAPGMTMPNLVGAGDLALTSMPQVSASTLGMGSAAGSGSSLVNGIKSLNDLTGGNLGAIAGGLLGAAASGDTTTSTNRDPWGPAQGYLKDNLATNANMQKYYQANPFSQEQKTAYQGLLNTNANNQANAPIMQANANSFMQSKRGAMPQMQGLLSGTQAAPIDWSKYANIGKG